MGRKDSDEFCWRSLIEEFLKSGTDGALLGGERGVRVLCGHDVMVRASPPSCLEMFSLTCTRGLGQFKDNAQFTFSSKF